jgi:hypothetical protein
MCIMTKTIKCTKNQANLQIQLLKPGLMNIINAHVLSDLFYFLVMTATSFE